MVVEKKSIHNNIARLRKERGYTQIEFAEMVGITNWWLSNIESGKHSPGLVLAMRIADKLGVTLNDIFLN